ncbi:aspartate aminotransferase family protein [Agrobacterium leguminum]|uniref:Aspartate aminotransferase family protein n=1 Tax=Agrobacterium leguminum TaxID=2792015 RepID=A0A9X3QWN0_9HYPH|nr:aspartate aminotransferase family protein [Agrobacterium leguminum]MCZ7911486.1 aspartate aminotransferase family protein [Agrobacterium leguminum]
MSDYEHLRDLDAKHMIHTFLPLETRDRTIFVKGKGCNLWDVAGRDYLDMTGGLWLAQIGHGRPEMAEAAAKQMTTLEYATAFWEFSNDKAITLAAKLAALSPAGLDVAYFTSGGSEGNDAAIKTARLFHAHRGEPDRTWILSRSDAYHGLAYGGGTATGFDGLKAGVGPGIGHVHHLTPPKPFQTWRYNGQSTTDFCIAELEATIAKIGAKNIAAMIGEPVMGVGGMVIPPDDYWPRVAQVLHKNGILLILDEVVTAFGRIGSWFGADKYNVSPDIVVTAKGISSGYIPLGAVLMTREIADAVCEGHGFPVGYTYSGHPVACAIALENLRILEEERLVERANVMGRYFSEGLQPLKDLPCVGEIRHAGLGIAIELVSDRKSRHPLPDNAIPDVIKQESGVIVRMANENVLVLSPPLVVTESEADRAIEAVSRVLARVRADGSVSNAAAA